MKHNSNFFQIKKKNYIYGNRSSVSTLSPINVSFRCGGYVPKLGKDWTGDEHTLNFTKVYYVSAGNGAHITVDGKEYILSEGNFYIIPEFQTHSFYMEQDKLLSKYYCHINVHIFDTDAFNFCKLPICIKALDSNEAVSIFKSLVDCAAEINAQKKPSYYKLFEEKSLLLKLVSYIFECYEKSKAAETSENKNPMVSVKEYIKENICSEITIETLAEIAHIHPNYFISKFKKIYGITPHQMIIVEKCERAKELLLSTSLSVADIAEYLGYESSYSFSNQFKKVVGESPLRYRIKR